MDTPADNPCEGNTADEPGRHYVPEDLGEIIEIETKPGKGARL